MAKFSDVKSQLTFIYGTAPVLVVSLKKELIENASKEEKESKRKKELLRLEKVFNSKLSKDIYKKGYEIIEDYLKLDDEVEDILLDSDYKVVVGKGSFIYLSDLKDNEQAMFSAGIRIMDEEGQIAKLPDIVEFQQIKEVCTNLSEAIEQYDLVIDSLREIEEKGLSEEIVIEEPVTEEIVIEEPVTEEIVIEEPVTKEPVIEGESRSAKYSKFHHEDNETRSEFGIEKTSSEKNTKTNEQNNEIKDLSEEGQQVVNKLLEEFSIAEIPYVDFYEGTLQNLEKFEELEPLIKISEVNINSRIEKANREIENVIKKAVGELSHLSLDMLQSEHNIIEQQTSLTYGSNPFKTAMKEIETKYEEQLKEIDILVEEKNSYLKEEYEEEKNAVGEQARKEAIENFERSNIGRITEEKDKYKTTLLNNLNQQILEAKENLKEQSTIEREHAVSELIPKVFELISDEIKNKKEETTNQVEQIVEKAIKQNEIETIEIQEKSFEFAMKQKENKELVEKEVTERTKKAQQIVKDLEAINKKYDELFEQNKEKTDEIEKLTNIRSELESQLNNTVNNFNALLQTKTDNELSFQQKMSERKDEKPNVENRKMAVVLGGVIIGCITFLGMTYIIADSIKDSRTKSVNEPQETIVKKIEEYNSSTDSSNNEQGGGFKIGDPISIDPESNGKSVEAIVKKIEGNNLLVETKNGEEFYVTLEGGK